MTNVADKLTTIADNIPKVYDAGKRVGAETNEAFEEGKKEARREWWSKYVNIQPNGEGRVYSGNDLFSGPGWTDDTFDLPCTINDILRADYMFQSSGRIDLKGILERGGIAIQFDKCTLFQYMFYYSQVYNIPEIDCSKATNMQGMFDNNTAVTNIDAIIMPSVESNFTNMFNNCSALENIRFKGTISQNGINLQWSKSLNKYSIKSLIEALSESGSGKTITLSFDAVFHAFTPSGREELMAIASEKGWEVNLV